MENLTKEEILKGLILDEKDTLSKLKELVDESKELIRIEGHSGKVVIIKNDVSLKDKIVLLLIGKYFAKESGLINSQKLNLEAMKNELNAESRALSRPLGDLLRENIIENENGEYFIKYYQIENAIKNISEQKIMPRISKPRTKKSVIKKEPLGKKEEKTLIKDSVEKLAQKTDLTVEELKHIFDFEENDVRIIHPVEGKESERQLNATLLYLTVYKYCFGLEEIDSGDLRKKLTDLGIGSLVNLSSNLKRYKNYLVHKMTARGTTDTSYRITIPGELYGIKIIKELGNKNKKEMIV